MDQDEILMDTEERMEKAMLMFQGQLQGIRTGRATSGLVDSIRVEYYGSAAPLKQLATISVSEQQIVIRPFDATNISGIVKAIQGSDVGLAPNSDGRLIRLNVPPLSTERRRQLAQVLRTQLDVVEPDPPDERITGIDGARREVAFEERRVRKCIGNGDQIRPVAAADFEHA